MTEKLQIYKDTYSLVRLLYAAMPQMDKMHRRQIGERIIDSSLDMTDRIDPKWWTYMYVDNHHKKVVLRPEYSQMNIMKEFLTNK